MSLEVDGFWKAGFWSTTFWAEGFWFEGAPAPTPVVETQGRGNINWKKKRKGKTIRFSDFETREEYAKALAAAALPIIQPKHDVPAPIEEEDEDDEILMALLTKIIH